MNNNGQDVVCFGCKHVGNTAHDMTWNEVLNAWVCDRCDGEGVRMYGAFRWVVSGSYQPKEAVRLFQREKDAEKFCDRENEKGQTALVVRPVWA